MKHFRLNIILLIIGIIALSVWLGALMVGTGHTVLMSAVAVALVVLVIRLLHIARQLVRQMSSFVSALRNNDFMIRFPQSDDTELCEMFSAMNDITALYRNCLTEIETKRHYYDRILKIMSHELRNSITPVVSLTHDMLKRPQVYHGGALHEGLEVIHGQCVSIKHFLDSYYEMTHLPKPQNACIDVCRMLTRIRQLFAQELQKPEHRNVELRFGLGQGMTVEGDEAMLNQVLVNLITNAIQATSGREHPLIEVLASTPDGKPCITVSDNGTGIADDIKEDIFQPFFTTHTEGTGIGLCISRQIMRLHGGDLTVTSKEGHGAQFVMTFA